VTFGLPDLWNIEPSDYRAATVPAARLFRLYRQLLIVGLRYCH